MKDLNRQEVGVERKETLREFEIDTSFERGGEVTGKLKEVFEKTFDITLEIEQILKDAGWSPLTQEVNGQKIEMDGIVAIKEPIDNAVVHGNAGLVKKDEEKDLVLQTAERIQERLNAGEDIPKAIKIEITKDEFAVYVKITDGGKGFNWRKLVSPLTEENLLHSSGRGIYLTLKTFGLENVSFNEQGNEITLRAVMLKNN